MKKLYYIKNNDTGKLLNRKGGWSNNFTSYRLASFETKEAAEASAPSGIEYKIIEILEKTEFNNLNFKFYLKDLKTKYYLYKSNEFKAYTVSDSSVIMFDTEDLALDKAEDLNINLEEIRVIRSQRVEIEEKK
jgi:hypothetical protein